jgi:hypothetical protein
MYVTARVTNFGLVEGQRYWAVKSNDKEYRIIYDDSGFEITIAAKWFN